MGNDEELNDIKDQHESNHVVEEEEMVVDGDSMVKENIHFHGPNLEVEEKVIFDDEELNDIKDEQESNHVVEEEDEEEEMLVDGDSMIKENIHFHEPNLEVEEKAIFNDEEIN